MKKYVWLFGLQAFLYECKKVELNPGNIMFYHQVNGKMVSVVYLPTAFSPNADGINDLYKAVTYGGMSVLFRMTIYDNHNIEIFATTDRNLGWDGMSGGIKKYPGEYQSELVLMDTTGYVYDIHSKVVLLDE